MRPTLSPMLPVNKAPLLISSLGGYTVVFNLLTSIDGLTTPSVSTERYQTATYDDGAGGIEKRYVKLPEHCIREEGARIVTNLYPTATDLAETALNIPVVIGRVYQLRIGSGSDSGATAVCSDAFTGTLTADGINDISFNNGIAKTAVTETLSVTITGNIRDIALSDVTNRTNQYPDEYVSVGIGTGSEEIPDVNFSNLDFTIHGEGESGSGWIWPSPTVPYDYEINAEEGLKSTVTSGPAQTVKQSVPNALYIVTYTLNLNGTQIKIGDTKLSTATAGTHTEIVRAGPIPAPLVFVLLIGGRSMSYLSVKRIDHGLNVDGVKSFPYSNPCTVDANGIVTEDMSSVIHYDDMPELMSETDYITGTDWNLYVSSCVDGDIVSPFGTQFLSLNFAPMKAGARYIIEFEIADAVIQSNSFITVYSYDLTAEQYIGDTYESINGRHKFIVEPNVGSGLFIRYVAMSFRLTKFSIKEVSPLKGLLTGPDNKQFFGSSMTLSDLPWNKNDGLLVNDITDTVPSVIQDSRTFELVSPNVGGSLSQFQSGISIDVPVTAHLIVKPIDTYSASNDPEIVFYNTNQVATDATVAISFGLYGEIETISAGSSIVDFDYLSAGDGWYHIWIENTTGTAGAVALSLIPAPSLATWKIQCCYMNVGYGELKDTRNKFPVRTTDTSGGTEISHLSDAPYTISNADYPEEKGSISYDIYIPWNLTGKGEDTIVISSSYSSGFAVRDDVDGLQFGITTASFYRNFTYASKLADHRGGHSYRVRACWDKSTNLSYIAAQRIGTELTVTGENTIGFLGLDKSSTEALVPANAVDSANFAISNVYLSDKYKGRSWVEERQIVTSIIDFTKPNTLVKVPFSAVNQASYYDGKRTILKSSNVKDPNGSIWIAEIPAMDLSDAEYISLDIGFPEGHGIGFTTSIILSNVDDLSSYYQFTIGNTDLPKTIRQSLNKKFSEGVNATGIPVDLTKIKYVYIAFDRTVDLPDNSLDEVYLYGLNYNKKQKPKITFIFGGTKKSIYDNAYISGAMKTNDIKGVISINGSLVDSDASHLSTSEIDELVADGWEVGNNTFSGNPLVNSIQSLTWVSGIATATTKLPHGLTTNDTTTISGSDPLELNGLKIITKVNDTSFTFETALSDSTIGTTGALGDINCPLQLTTEAITAEIVNNENFITSKGWNSVKHFSYPEGCNSDELVDILKSLNFKSANTLHTSSSNNPGSSNDALPSLIGNSFGNVDPFKLNVLKLNENINALIYYANALYTTSDIIVYVPEVVNTVTDPENQISTASFTSLIASGYFSSTYGYYDFVTLSEIINNDCSVTEPVDEKNRVSKISPISGMFLWNDGLNTINRFRSVYRTSRFNNRKRFK